LKSFWQHWLSFQRVVRKLVACNTVIFALSTITTTQQRDARERGKQREFSRQMQKQKSENKQQLFFEAHSLLFCSSSLFVLSQREEIFDQLNPTSLFVFVCTQKTKKEQNFSKI